MAQPNITLRSVKGAPLSWQEGDNNFSNLAAAALPTGGATGQVLVKSSETDYAVSFVDPSTLQGATGFTGSVGFTGSAGIGFTGSQGDQGIQGFTGSQGPIGFTGSAGTGGGGSISELTDVTITDITTNDVLVWNGTAWVNSPVLGDIEAALQAINGA